MNEEEYIDEIIEDIFATEHQKEYKTEYYKQHRDRYNQQYLKWCKDNPKQAKAIRDRWRAKNPHYSRDYERKRKAVTESLIFQFLDNGVGSDIGGYIIYLRNRGVPEHHIGWFRKDVERMVRLGTGDMHD
jgi:hypothetical protein